MSIIAKRYQNFARPIVVLLASTINMNLVLPTSISWTGTNSGNPQYCPSIAVILFSRQQGIGRPNFRLHAALTSEIIVITRSFIMASLKSAV